MENILVKYPIGTKVNVLNNYPPKIAYRGFIVAYGYHKTETGKPSYVVELERGFYADDKACFISQLVVNHDNIEPVRDSEYCDNCEKQILAENAIYDDGVYCQECFEAENAEIYRNEHIL